MRTRHNVMSCALGSGVAFRSQVLGSGLRSFCASRPGLEQSTSDDPGDSPGTVCWRRGVVSVGVVELAATLGPDANPWPGIATAEFIAREKEKTMGYKKCSRVSYMANCEVLERHEKFTFRSSPAKTWPKLPREVQRKAATTHHWNVEDLDRKWRKDRERSYRSLSRGRNYFLWTPTSIRVGEKYKVKVVERERSKCRNADQRWTSALQLYFCNFQRCNLLLTWQNASPSAYGTGRTLNHYKYPSYTRSLDTEAPESRNSTAQRTHEILLKTRKHYENNPCISLHLRPKAV